MKQFLLFLISFSLFASFITAANVSSDDTRAEQVRNTRDLLEIQRKRGKKTRVKKQKSKRKNTHNKKKQIKKLIQKQYAKGNMDLTDSLSKTLTMQEIDSANIIVDDWYSVMRSWQTSTPIDTSGITPYNRYDVYFLEAQRQAQCGNPQHALALLQLCQQLRPDVPVVYVQMAENLLQISQDQSEGNVVERVTSSNQPESHTFDKIVEQAEAYIQKAVNLDSTNIEYRQNLISILLYQQKYKEANQEFEWLYQHDLSARAEILTNQSSIYTALGDWDNVVRVLREYQDLEGADEQVQYMMIMALDKAGKTDLAHTELLHWWKQHPNNFDFLNIVINWLLSHQKEEEALSLLQETEQNNPNNHDLYVSYLLYYQHKKDNNGIDTYLYKLLHHPETTEEERIEIIGKSRLMVDSTTFHTKYYPMLVQITQQEQAPKEAFRVLAENQIELNMPIDTVINTIERCASLYKDTDNDWRYVLAIYAGKAQWNEMEQMARYLLQVNPASPTYLYGLVVPLITQDKQEDFLKACDTYLPQMQAKDDQEKATLSEIYASKGDILAKQDKKLKAFKAYETALQHDPNNANCLNNYAYYLSENREHLAKAEMLARKAIQNAPDMANYIDTYAWILFLRKSYPEALEQVKDLVKLISDGDKDSVSAEVYEHIGDIYAVNRDMKNAMTYWQLSKDNGNNSPQLNKKITQKRYIHERKNDK